MKSNKQSLKAGTKKLNLRVEKLQKRMTPRSMAADYGGGEVAALAQRSTPGVLCNFVKSF